MPATKARYTNLKPKFTTLAILFIFLTTCLASSKKGKAKTADLERLRHSMRKLLQNQKIVRVISRVQKHLAMKEEEEKKKEKTETSDKTADLKEDPSAKSQESQKTAVGSEVHSTTTKSNKSGAGSDDHSQEKDQENSSINADSGDANVEIAKEKSPVKSSKTEPQSESNKNVEADEKETSATDEKESSNQNTQNEEKETIEETSDSKDKDEDTEIENASSNNKDQESQKISDKPEENTDQKSTDQSENPEPSDQNPEDQNSAKSNPTAKSPENQTTEPETKPEESQTPDLENETNPEPTKNETQNENECLDNESEEDCLERKLQNKLTHLLTVFDSLYSSMEEVCSASKSVCSQILDRIKDFEKLRPADARERFGKILQETLAATADNVVKIAIKELDLKGEENLTKLRALIDKTVKKLRKGFEGQFDKFEDEDDLKEQVNSQATKVLKNDVESFYLNDYLGGKAVDNELESDSSQIENDSQTESTEDSMIEEIKQVADQDENDSDVESSHNEDKAKSLAVTGSHSSHNHTDKGHQSKENHKSLNLKGRLDSSHSSSNKQKTLGHQKKNVSKHSKHRSGKNSQSKRHRHDAIDDQKALQLLSSLLN